MIGDIVGPRAGAATYNAGHLYASPAVLLPPDWRGMRHRRRPSAELDRVHRVLQLVGYGSELPLGFGHTVYGPIGRARAQMGPRRSAVR
jgi:hypothetical protein